MKRRILWGSLAIFLSLAALVGGQAWYHLMRRVPRAFPDVVDLFKYGPNGGEEPAGIPLHIWAVLPDVFADKLPRPVGPGEQPYEPLGLIYEPGHDTPVGISVETIGFPRISNNCAFCHISSYRARLEDPPTRVLAGTRQDFDAQRYLRFILASGADERFDAEHLMPAIHKRFPDLPVALSLAYHFFIIGKVKEALLANGARFAWWNAVPDCGPGRWEAFNDLKYFFAHQPVDGGIGNPDIPSLWNMRVREAAGVFHWDGFNDKLYKSAYNASIGSGATPKTLPKDLLERLMAWWRDIPPPKYPFAIDAEAAARGQVTWTAQCAGCHEIGRPGAGRNIPLAEIGTDPQRHDMMNAETVAAYNTWVEGEFKFGEWQLRTMPGYNSVFLDGIWLRAPYLHNGSVPTLTDLLRVPAERPQTFRRGSDLYDQAKVGFVTEGPAVADLFLYDTALPGNHNSGHTYGTDLPEADKADLVEYLKTL